MFEQDGVISDSQSDFGRAGQIVDWVPPPDLTTHAGTPLPSNMQFFAAPPSELGQLTSACSSLKRGKGPMPFMFSQSVFRQTCSYIGEKGVAQFHASGDFEMEPKQEILLFGDTAKVRTGFTGTSFCGIDTGVLFECAWYDAQGRLLLKLGGSQPRKPEPTAPYHFATAAKGAWNTFILYRLLAEIDQRGWIEFPLKPEDTLCMGPGFIEFKLQGQVERLTVDDIRNFGTRGGAFVFYTHDAKSFGRCIKIAYSDFELGNSCMFPIFLNKLLGLPN